jgi:hypothetical protein
MRYQSACPLGYPITPREQHQTGSRFAFYIKNILDAQKKCNRKVKNNNYLSSQ